MPSLTVVFYLLAAIAVASGILMITRRNAMQSALFLILNFISLAGIYLTLNAQFVAIIQILVYAGAIMVLVLFVIMLLNLQDDVPFREQRGPNKYISVAMGVALLGMLVYVITIAGASRLSAFSSLPERSVDVGTVEHIGLELFSRYAFPVEITGVLLLAAIVGAVVLAKKKFP